MKFKTTRAGNILIKLKTRILRALITANGHMSADSKATQHGASVFLSKMVFSPLLAESYRQLTDLNGYGFWKSKMLVRYRL